MNQNLPQDIDRESLNQLSKQGLVEIIIEQSKVIRELQKMIYELHLEVERLKVSRDLDSKTSSKPPSGDILKKSENKKAPLEEEPNHLIVAQLVERPIEIVEYHSVYNGCQVVQKQKCLAPLHRHFKKLIILPVLHNQAIGETFVNLIDEAFSNYARWFETLDSSSYKDWVNKFKAKLHSSLNQWIDKAGATAGQLLRYFARSSKPMLVFS